MAGVLERIDLPREFVFTNEDDEEVRLPDPDPEMPVEQVLSHYAGHYPKLTTAKVGAPEVKNDKLVYIVESSVGTKG